MNSQSLDKSYRNERSAMTNRFVVALLAITMLLGFAPGAHAVLQAVDPGPYLAAFGFYPAWYQDTTGLKLELCLSEAVSPNPAAAGGQMCLLSAPDPTAPIVFPTNFGDENFYFTADSLIDVTQGLKMILVQAVEGAFSVGPVINGDQITFARIRIRIDVPASGDYIVTTPYGTFEFPGVVQGGGREINFTEDIGIGAPGNFTGALGGKVGPFLQAAATPGGAPTPTIIGAETFIGDPNIDQAVTGSPFGNNFFRVQGPGIGALTPTPPAFSCGPDCIQTDMFAVSGKVFDGRLPTSVIVDRSTYSRNALGASHVDVFATSPVGSTLSFRDTLTGLTEIPMVGDGTGKFYGQELTTSVQSFVYVTATNPAGTTRPATLASPVVDVVKITKAQYALDTRTLRIEATSSDQFAPPTLIAVGFGQLTAGTLNAPMAQPPARVTVVSSQGGRDTEPVQIVPTFPGAANRNPVAVNDSATTAQRTAVNIAVLANDNDPDGNLPLTVVNLTQPAAGTGTAALQADNTVTYTPPTGFAGQASFTYQARDALGALSNVATVTVTVTNAAPIALDDNAATTAGTAVNIAVLANDSDPDGNTPLTVVSLTQPAAGTGAAVLQANNTVTYTPTAGFTGTASFTYQARDTLGALSNVATVRVTVSNVVVVETITATATAQINVRQGTASWTISGTTNVLTPAHTMTVRLTRTGAQIDGTVTTDARGRWKVTAAKSNIIPQAGDTITVTSSLGTTRTFPVTIK
jgi:Big-like domain-containing protein